MLRDTEQVFHILQVVAKKCVFGKPARQVGFFEVVNRVCNLLYRQSARLSFWMRCVMAQAAAQYEVDLERVSFKGALDAVRQYSNPIGQARNRKLRRQLWEDLLLNRARDLVRRRPNRTEPRTVKHRPKPYPLLNQPRHRFVEISHRSDYWKGRARNYRRLN